MTKMDKAYLELCDFDYGIYRNYEDLKLMDKLALEDHFLNFGIQEGRAFNSVKDRKDFVDLVSKEGKMLEIGPLDNPQLNHQSPNYYSLDVFDKEQLTKNYIDHPNVNKEKIIEPSYVIVNNDYSQIKEKFNTVFSCHSIEHMPCVVTFLNNIENLLSEDGYGYLIVPDKRYCFDHFKRESEIYDVLQLFYEKNTRPRLSANLKMLTQSTHNDCIAHWNNDHGEINSENALLQLYHGILTQYNTGEYIDSHVSHFTPQSFMQIVNSLNNLKLINLKIHKIYHTLTNSNEFYVILKKSKK